MQDRGIGRLGFSRGLSPRRAGSLFLAVSPTVFPLRMCIRVPLCASSFSHKDNGQIESRPPQWPHVTLVTS